MGSKNNSTFLQLDPSATALFDPQMTMEREYRKTNYSAIKFSTTTLGGNKSVMNRPKATGAFVNRDASMVSLAVESIQKV
jgi:hypothetical protein